MTEFDFFLNLDLRIPVPFSLYISMTSVGEYQFIQMWYKIKLILYIHPKLIRHNQCNFFTYVTKTCSNLSTYSRKPGNYNGTIIFDIDIMEKSSPINLKFIFATVKTKMALLFWCSQLMLSVVLQCRQKQTKQPKHQSQV